MTRKYGMIYPGKEGLHKNGYTCLQVAVELEKQGISRSPSTVSQYINGYREIPEEIRGVLDRLSKRPQGGIDDAG